LEVLSPSETWFGMDKQSHGFSIAVFFCLGVGAMTNLLATTDISTTRVIALIVVGGISFSIAAVVGANDYGVFRGVSLVGMLPRLIVILGISWAIPIVLGEMVWPEPPPLAVYLDCQMNGTEIHVRPESTAYIMPLHPHLSPNSPPFFSGFEEVIGYNADRIWPSEKESPPAPIPSPEGHPAAIMYKCDVKNGSKSTLEKVWILFKVLMERDSSPGAPTAQYYYRIRADAITPSAPFSFYVVNECPSLFAYVYFPTEAEVKVFGEEQPRPVRLLRPLRNLMGVSPALMLAPGFRTFEGKPSCDIKVAE
jgi:hypothetical protein